MPEARLMIVEDEVGAAGELSRSLEACGYSVVGCASTAHSAVQLAGDLTPDLVLVKLRRQDGTNSIDLAREIAERVDTGVIYLSDEADDSMVEAAANAGALAFIVEPFHVSQITSAIKVALRRREDVRALRPRAGTSEGNPPFSTMLQRVQSLLADERAWSTGEGLPAACTLAVTPREREVVRGLVCYRRLARVAQVLGISIHTARNHLKSVLRKLNLHSQDELLQFLLEGRERA